MMIRTKSSILPNANKSLLLRLLLSAITVSIINSTSTENFYNGRVFADNYISQSPFRIIIDGGSTGSRLHLFEFTTNITNNETKCTRRGSWKARVPMSAFGRTPSEINAGKYLNPFEVADHLIPLFDNAAEIIPDEFHATTGVTYQATAGMRLLDEDEQDLVYDALYEGLYYSRLSNGAMFPFRSFGRGDIATLGGEKEGFYAAVAANYLSGAIDVHLKLIVNGEDDAEENHGPVGALDMGGSSTQLVFLPPMNGTCEALPTQSPIEDEDVQTCQNDQIPERLDGDDFFSTSYLSYGVDQFRERLWNKWVRDCETENAAVNCTSGTILNPCGFQGYTTEWDGYTLYGTGDAYECSNQIRRLIPSLDEHSIEEEISDLLLQSSRRTVGGVEHPPVRGKFFAMSNFFYVLDSMRVLSHPETDAYHVLNRSWPNPSIEELNDALEGFCSRSWQGDLEEIQHNAHKYTSANLLPNRCIESAYIISLLRDGFGFQPSSRDITFTYDVDGSEVEWTLGMALSTFAEEESAKDITTTETIEFQSIVHKAERSHSFNGTTEQQPNSCSATSCSADEAPRPRRVIPQAWD